MKVYCKLPHGIKITLRDNQRRVREIKLNGYLSKWSVAGFGVTTVDNELWLEAQRVYGNLLSGKFIFAVKNNDNSAEAKNRESEKCGFERLNAAAPELIGAAQGVVTADFEINSLHKEGHNVC